VGAARERVEALDEEPRVADGEGSPRRADAAQEEARLPRVTMSERRTHDAEDVLVARLDRLRRGERGVLALP
jgi:hypothetical protein